MVSNHQGGLVLPAQTIIKLLPMWAFLVSISLLLSRLNYLWISLESLWKKVTRWHLQFTLKLSLISPFFTEDLGCFGAFLLLTNRTRRSQKPARFCLLVMGVRSFFFLLWKEQGHRRPSFVFLVELLRLLGGSHCKRKLSQIAKDELLIEKLISHWKCMSIKEGKKRGLF